MAAVATKDVSNQVSFFGVVMKHLITGKMNAWTVFGNTRQFATVVVPFEVACDIFKSTIYNGATGRGEQREIHAPHSRKLQREIRNGTYTPTPVAVGTHKSHRDTIVYNGLDFELLVDKSNPLPLIDGHHRFDGIDEILKSLTERLKSAKTDADKELLEAQVEQVYKLPIAVTVYLDGDPQTDFVNLQLGRSVDPSHMLTMKIRRNMGATPEMANAFEIAKALASAESGPFAGQIRFDSRGKMPLPISTLCTKGSSDLSTSLAGLARVCGNIPPKQLAEYVSQLYTQLRADCPEVLEYGKVMTPIGNGGTKGSSTMLIGVAICVVHDLVAHGKLRLSDAVDAARATMNRAVAGSFTASNKRDLMGEFAESFFSSYDGEKHDRLPIDLLQLISPTAYSCESLPKVSKVVVTATAEVLPKEKPEVTPEAKPKEVKEVKVAKVKAKEVGASTKSNSGSTPKSKPKAKPKAKTKIATTTKSEKVSDTHPAEQESQVVSAPWDAVQMA